MKHPTREEFLIWAGGFLLGMLLLALLLAAAAGLTPLHDVHWSLRDAAIGAAAALVMLGAFGFIAPVRDQAEEILGPSLAACRWSDLLILAALVGIVEELLFRGVLEPWLARWHPLAAFIGVNALFGALHAVSLPYALVAGALGMILSALAHHPGDFNLLRPITAHAVYDYLGFLLIVRSTRAAQRSLEVPLPEPNGE